ncbi:PUA domain-containing protein [[Eubacterium] cellulosolvens]
MRKPTEFELIKLRGIANYQFGKGAGERLFPKSISIEVSRRTKKIRSIYFRDTLLATLRPTNGLFALTIFGADRLMKNRATKYLKVCIQSDISPFIIKGGDVFAKHVIRASPRLKPQEEVLIVDKSGKLLAVGRAILSGEEMLSFKSGVAVKVRKGIEED